MRFSSKLCALFSAVILLMGTGISFFVYSSNVKILEAHIEDRLRNQAFHTMDKIDILLFERYGDIRTLASDTTISSRKSTPKQITERLLEFKKSYRNYFSLSFFNLNRVRIADTEGKDIGRQHALSEYWPEISGGKDLTYSIDASESINQAVIYFASVVKDGNGVPFGVVVSRVPIESLYEIVRQGVGIFNVEKDFLIELVDKDGRIIYSNHDVEAILKATSPDWVLISEAVKKGEKTGVVKHAHSTVKRGEEILVFGREQGYAGFKGSDWTLITEVPTKVAFASAVEIRNRILVISLLMSLFAFAVTRLLASRISKPIERLSAASEEVAKGNLDIKVDVTTADETGKLAETFNRMTADLKKQRDKLLSYSKELETRVEERTAELKGTLKKLESAERRYHSLVEHMPSAITYVVPFDMDDRFAEGAHYISSQIESLLGFTQAEWLADPPLYFRQVHPEDIGRVMEAFESHKHKDSVQVEYRMLTRDNRTLWIHDQSTVIRDNHGTRLIQGIAFDITSLKETEKVLRKANELLKKSEAGLAKAQQIGRLGNWESDMKSGDIFWSDEMYRIYGFKDERFKPTFEIFLDRVHPEDRAYVISAVESALRDNKPQGGDFRIVLPDGTVRYMHSEEELILDDAGRPVGLRGITQDITERKRAEEEIISISKFPAENPNPVLRVSADGTLLYANKSSQSLLEAWGGCSTGQLLPSHVRGLASYSMRSGLSTEVEAACRDAIFSLIFTPVPGAEYMNIYGREITLRKKEQEELQKNRDLLQSIIDNSTAVIYLKDLDGRYMLINKWAEDSIHLSKGELLGKTDHDIFPKDIADPFRNNDRMAIECRHPVEFEEVALQNGMPHTYISIKFPLLDSAGNPYAICGISTDITERKQMEEELKEYSGMLEKSVRERTRELVSANTELRKIFNAIEQSTDSVVITDMNGTIQYVNPAFTRISGYSKTEAIGQNPRVLKSDKNPPEMYNELWATILSGGIWRGAIINKKKSGELYHEEMTITPVLDEHGGMTNFVAIKKDVTDRVKAEEELRQKNIELVAARDMAQAANIAKSEFLANMSHELRTPLNAVIGFSQVILEGMAGPVTGEQKDYVKDIHESGQNLLSIISDILELSKIEIGETEPDLKEFDIRPLLEESRALFKDKASRRNISATIDMEEDIETVYADKRMLKQIVVNLLSNAFKFTPDGGSVRISARKGASSKGQGSSKDGEAEAREDEKAVASRKGQVAREEDKDMTLDPWHLTTDGNFLEISVVDTGIGITQEDMERLFVPFQQLEPHLTKKHGGAGVGLYLAKRLVELHHGKIWAESEKDKGSKFSFVIPMRQRQNPESRSQEPE